MEEMSNNKWSINVTLLVVLFDQIRVHGKIYYKIDYTKLRLVPFITSSK
jgi:hypothetical protein